MTLLVIIGVLTLISTLYIILSENNRDIVYVTVTAGSTEFRSTEVKSLQEINIKINNKTYSSFDDRYLFIRINGSSMKDFKGKLSNDDLAIVDKEICILKLKENDPIVLIYNHEDGKSYKARSYLGFEDNILKSQTIKNGKKCTSSHDFEKSEYVGKVIVRYPDFFKKHDIN